MPLQRRRRKESVLDRPVLGSVHKQLPKGIKYEDYSGNLSSCEDTDAKSDRSGTPRVPKVSENFYTDRLFGEPLTNYYSLGPSYKDSKTAELKELESNAKDDLVLIAKVVGAKNSKNQCKSNFNCV